MSFWRFLPAGTHAAGLHSHHDPGLVAVSAGMAMVAAFAALAVVDRIAASPNRRAATTWLALGAGVMGLGIWAMHFTAMLAFRLPVAVSYDPLLTATSLVPAVLGSGAAIRVLSRPSESPWRRRIAAVPMVLGIGTMHFTGMEAVHASVGLMYRPVTFFLSLLVCYVLAAVALETRPQLRRVVGSPRLVHGFAAVLMGLAVTCMHHTAMAAAVFLPPPGTGPAVPALDGSLLALFVTLGSLIVVGLTLVATLVDTRLATAARSLKSSEARYRAVLETMSDGVFTLTPAGMIDSVNHTGAAGFGYEAARVPGMGIAQLLPAAAAEVLSATRARVTTEGRRQDGSTFPVEVSVTAMTIHGERLLSAVVRDTTEERRQQESLAKYILQLEKASASLRRQSRELAAERDRAQDAARAKSEFLATMSHEIRTPMNGILGTAEVLMDSPLTAEQAEQLRIIRASGEALLQVINQILDFSKIEAGKLALDRAAFDMASVAEAARVLLAPVAERKGVELLVDLDGHRPRLLGDPFRLQQVVVNLVANAIKFTAEGRVVIAVRGAAEGPSWRTRVTVRDTGIGIDSATQQRLFTPFSQADASTTRRYGGTGLGLAICRQLIDLMSGTIGVDSTPGQGATFWFEVVLPGEAPAADGARAGLPAPAHAARAAVPGRGWRVLLAEDNATNQKVAMLMLSALGCQVEVAPSGRHAVEAWRAGSFDLILMDCQMPEMDGFEATRTIRDAERDGARTPIVAVTANAMEGDRERCLAAGMDDYVTKPLTKAGLAGGLDRLVERGLLEERRQAAATAATRG